MRWLLLALFVFTNITDAYETITHSEISNESIRQSILVQDPEILISLGIILETGVNEEAFPSIAPSDPNGSDPNDTIFLEEASIVRILTGGSVLEDVVSRSANHFFDPQNGGVGGSIGIPSPDWILESIIAPQTGEEIQVTLGNQDFSYKDAQQYFYNALTSPDDQGRLINFGLMFRSLGHVIHHLQDMAQPQHVRSDDHCDATTDFLGIAFLCFLVGKHNPSYYENYTNTRIIDLPVSPTDIPVFQTARNYWGNTMDSGIAEYTSRNFVSAGTNYQGNDEGFLTSHPSFTRPAPLPEVISISLADLLTEDTVILDEAKQSLLERLQCDVNECLLDFIQNVIIDTQDGGGASVNTRSSTISIFDEEIRSRNLIITNDDISTYTTRRIPSLNRFNFEAVYPFLLPRAVAHSTSLINHFFRARLEVVAVGWGDFSNFVIRVNNISTQGDTFEDGKFKIFYESTRWCTKIHTARTFS